jgi:hypothetical protein
MRGRTAPAVGRLATAVLLLSATGCNGRHSPGVAPRDVEQALTRVNDNLGRIEGMLYCAGLVSFRCKDDQGKTHRVPPTDAILFYRQPRDLKFEVRSPVGAVATFGSNDELYWLTIEETLWWGHWAAVHDPGTGRLPVPPGELLDALMLRPLPERLGCGLTPMLRVDEDDHRLLFVRLDGAGEPIGYREITLLPYEPYMPTEIVDWGLDGRVLMHAALGKYRRVGTDGPYTARHYVVRWPKDGAEFRLDVTRSEFRPDLANVPIRIPSWEGRIEQIDGERSSPGASGVDSGGGK